MAGITDLVIRPDTFFSQVSREKINLLPPLVIFGTGAILPVVTYIAALIFFTATKSLSAIPSPLLAMGRIFLLCNICLPLVGWALMSLWTYGISRSLGGEGSLAATARDTGYGLMPWTLSIITFMLFSGVLFIAGYAVPATVGITEAYAPIGYEAWPYLSLLVLIWEWYLWTLAAMHTHGFSFGRSAIITAIPVAALSLMIFPGSPVAAMIRNIV